MLRKNLSTEDTEGTDHRNLYGIYTEFFSSYARNLGGNLLWDVASQEINHRILDGIYTETKSLKKILTENTLEYLASGKGFYGDRLRLEILTRIFNRIFNSKL